MSAPLNSIDYIRFKKLAALIMRIGTGELSIYTSKQNDRPGKSYVAIEMRSGEIDTEEVLKSFEIPIEEIMKEV